MLRYGMKHWPMRPLKEAEDLIIGCSTDAGFTLSSNGFKPWASCSKGLLPLDFWKENKNNHIYKYIDPCSITFMTRPSGDWREENLFASKLSKADVRWIANSNSFTSISCLRLAITFVNWVLKKISSNISQSIKCLLQPCNFTKTHRNSFRELPRRWKHGTKFVLEFH